MYLSTNANANFLHFLHRGTSLESLVLMLTKDIHLLWGGSTLPPPSPGDKKCGGRNGLNVPGKDSIRHSPSEQQILNFILTMYPTFVHPVIFMRLLLHRYPSKFYLHELKALINY